MLFSIIQNKLKSNKQKSFDLEKTLQNLVESSIDEVFGFQFVATEFSIEDIRIDTVAFNPETNSFVLIEYKNKSNFSVIDQGMSYLQLLLSRKADFVLLYNEKYPNRQQKLSDIDWSQSSVIFISPEFTNFQIRSISFKVIDLTEVNPFFTPYITVDQYKILSNDEKNTNLKAFRGKSKKEHYNITDTFRGLACCSECKEKLSIELIAKYKKVKIKGKQTNYIDPKTKKPVLVNKYLYMRCLNKACIRFNQNTRSKVIIDFLWKTLDLLDKNFEEFFNLSKDELVRELKYDTNNLKTDIKSCSTKIVNKDKEIQVLLDRYKSLQSLSDTIPNDYLKKIVDENSNRYEELNTDLKSLKLLKEELKIELQQLQDTPITLQSFSEIWQKLLKRLNEMQSLEDIHLVTKIFFSKLFVDKEKVVDIILTKEFESMNKEQLLSFGD